VPEFEIRKEEIQGEIAANARKIYDEAQAGGHVLSPRNCRNKAYGNYLAENGHGYEVLFDAYVKNAERTLRQTPSDKKSRVETALDWDKFHVKMRQLGRRFGHENMNALVQLLSNAGRRYRIEIIGISLRQKKVWGKNNSWLSGRY